MTIHQEYLPESLPAEPLALVARWLEQATREAVQPNPNAMVLATADQHGQPSARVVLCKDIRPQPGYLTFFSNYESRKGTELAANPRAAAVMHWDRLHRQVRIEGPVVPAGAEESDAYFSCARLAEPDRCLGQSAEQHGAIARRPGGCRRSYRAALRCALAFAKCG